MSARPFPAGALAALALALLCGCAPKLDDLAQGKRLLEGQPDAATAAKARQHLQRAARAQAPAAAYHLGLLYRRGAPGLAPDAALARQWLREAAQTGLPDAEFMLGQMLAAGEGGPADAVQARQWFERAAEHDHPEANLELALAFQHGLLGLAADEAAAQRHFMEAQHALHHRPARP